MAQGKLSKVQKWEKKLQKEVCDSRYHSWRVCSSYFKDWQALVEEEEHSHAELFHFIDLATIWWYQHLDKIFDYEEQCAVCGKLGHSTKRRCCPIIDFHRLEKVEQKIVKVVEAQRLRAAVKKGKVIHKAEGKPCRREMVAFTDGPGSQSPRELNQQSYELPLLEAAFMATEVNKEELFGNIGNHEVVVEQQDKEQIQGQENLKIVELEVPASKAPFNDTIHRLVQKEEGNKEKEMGPKENGSSKLNCQGGDMSYSKGLMIISYNNKNFSSSEIYDMKPLQLNGQISEQMDSLKTTDSVEVKVIEKVDIKCMNLPIEMLADLQSSSQVVLPDGVHGEAYEKLQL